MLACQLQTTNSWRFFWVVNRLFSTTGSQLPLVSDVGTSDQTIMLKLFDHHLNRRSNSRESRWSFVNAPEMIIVSSGKGRKVWKSEVISPAVIVDTGSGSHVGSFRVDGTGSKQTNYTKICFIRKPNNTIRVLIGLCKFLGSMGPSCYIEYRGIRNRTIKGFYCIFR